MPLRHRSKLGMGRKSCGSKHVTYLHLSVVPNYSLLHAAPFSAPTPAPAPAPPQELAIDRCSCISNVMPQRSLMYYIWWWFYATERERLLLPLIAVVNLSQLYALRSMLDTGIIAHLFIWGNWTPVFSFGLCNTVFGHMTSDCPIHGNGIVPSMLTSKVSQ